MPDNTTLGMLLGLAATIGLVHTAIGVDHTIPFVALGRAGKWSYRKLWLVTGLCGVGHVLSSVVLGIVGAWLAVGIERLEWIEGERGTWASMLLVGFGLVLAVWGLVQARRGHRHAHLHTHADGNIHEHEHDHRKEHIHPHENKRKSALGVWSVFLIFVFGPCEPLIPLLMYPAVELSWTAMFLVAGVFSVATVGTMLVITTIVYAGMKTVRFPRLELYSNALAGIAIAASGAAIQVLGI